MQIQRWRITGNGFHFGRQGLGQEVSTITLSSDSLFAALVSRLAMQKNGKSLDEFLAPFLDDKPPFVLSSTFPFAGEVCFFPVPAATLRAEARLAGIRPKDLKKVRYVSEGLFRSLLSGTALAEVYPAAHKLQANTVLVSAEEATRLPQEISGSEDQIWSVEKRPRVTLGRAVQNSNIFFTGRVSFARDCGLWFAVHWMEPGEDLREELAFLLADLGDSGLGGERSVGFGACQITAKGVFDLPEARGKVWVSLSRYLPRPEEISALSHPMASYQLEQVGGWLESPIRSGQRRRSLNLLAAGSVFGPLDREAPGMIEDVHPSYKTDPDPLGHPVYRSGFALAVGMAGGAS